VLTMWYRRRVGVGSAVAVCATALALAGVGASPATAAPVRAKHAQTGYVRLAHLSVMATFLGLYARRRSTAWIRRQPASRVQ
jgi:hypothetical protein